MRIKNRVRARPEPMAPKIEFAGRFALADGVAALAGQTGGAPATLRLQPPLGCSADSMSRMS
jgi:hypothetical protein